MSMIQPSVHSRVWVLSLTLRPASVGDGESVAVLRCSCKRLNNTRYRPQQVFISKRMRLRLLLAAAAGIMLGMRCFDVCQSRGRRETSAYSPTSMFFFICHRAVLVRLFQLVFFRENPESVGDWPAICMRHWKNWHSGSEPFMPIGCDRVTYRRLVSERCPRFAHPTV